MDNLLLTEEKDPYVLRLLNKYYNQTNGNNGRDDGDYNTFFLHFKASILRSIQKRTSMFSVTDDILRSFVIIEEMDRQQGVPPSDALREAFSAVAVHRTLCWLSRSWAEYFDSVRRIWWKLIKDLEVSDSSGLLSPGLANWRKEVEAALWDRETAQRLSRINTLDKAQHRIKVYLREVFDSISATAHDVAYAPAYAHTEGNVDDVVTASTEVTLSHHRTDKGNMDDVISASVQAPSSLNQSTDQGNVDEVVSTPKVPSSPHSFTDKGNVCNAVSAPAQVPSGSPVALTKGIWIMQSLLLLMSRCVLI
ncbi:uncharacterized protein LOC120170605 [Hibiscus syriacus]|uniref:uncharacterized protein LOC120170605 n=1 Tax=Hibiscus syriacus TaxID=106335 RepID=UPI001921A1D3|nr:uncharacterized protein LOC120170605 [Hibiscus syriacus]